MPLLGGVGESDMIDIEQNRKKISIPKSANVFGVLYIHISVITLRSKFIILLTKDVLWVMNHGFVNVKFTIYVRTTVQ